MGKMQCDVCGGPLAVDVGGQSAICKNCGMEHSIERVREMLGTAPAAQPDSAAAEAVFDAGIAEIAVPEDVPTGYAAQLREIFRAHGGIPAPDIQPEQMEYAVLGEPDPKNFAVAFGQYGLAAQTSGILTEKQLEDMRKILDRCRKEQKGAKVWCRVMATVRHEGAWLSLVRPGEVLWELSGFSEETVRAAVSQIGQALPFEIYLVSPIDDAAPAAPDLTAEAEILDAGWVEIEENGGAKRDAQPFRMTVDDVFHILGQGVIVSGFVEGGSVHVGDMVTIIGKKTGQRRDVVVRALERFEVQHQSLCAADAAAPEDGVQLLLPGVGKKEVKAGDTVVGR